MEQVVYLRHCPKILFLRGEPISLVIEECVLNRLDEYLLLHEANSLPYLEEA
jgi:hypothetical protein